MITSVTICNSALLKLGADKISSLSETTRAATVCNALYAYLRDEVMSSSPWKFAIKRAIFTPTGTTPDFGWDNEYDIPSDCLRLLTADDSHIEWVQEGEKILSNETTLNMTYIFQNTDESSWSPLFAESLAWRLCMELSLALTQSTTMRDLAEKSYQKSLDQARSVNAVIGMQPVLIADVWSDARKGNQGFRRSAGQTT